METIQAESERLEWGAFPMKESPAKALLFWVVLVFTVWAVYWNIGSLLLTAFAAVLLLGSLTSFYLPTRYVIDHTGVTYKRGYHRRTIGWERVRSVWDERGGLFLSPFPVRSRLENFRGVFLPYRDNRERMLELIKHYAPEAAELASARKGKGSKG